MTPIQWFLLGVVITSTASAAIIAIFLQSSARIFRRKQAVIEFLSRELSKERMNNTLRDRVLNGGIERIERN